jgi:hypothetical protein
MTLAGTKSRQTYHKERRMQSFTIRAQDLATYITTKEIIAILSEHKTSTDRLAALEILAKPRLAYAWQQAGGHPRPGETPELIAQGKREMQEIRKK